VIHVYLARDLTPVPSAPEEHEVFEVRWLPMPEAVALASRGELRDGKSLVGLFWAAEAVRSNP
jgi:ADP-ribose pyrophosphatase